MNELEPLLKRIEQLTPYFGRASEDLAALTTRGRNQDYKGVLQNARLVLEMLLRSLVTTELKQTPGKAMLDELLNKFRQQAHGGLIPINILGHMGTVQAWGNLSSHDHAGGLDEAPVKVGLEEALASLNSLVAILSWYRERYVPEPAPAPTAAPAPAQTPALPAAPAPAAPASAPGTRPAGNRRLVVGGAVALAAVIAGAALLVAPEPPPATPSDDSSSALRRQVDALYVESEDPVPPADCKETDPEALGLLLHVGPLLSERVPEQERVQRAVEALQALRSRGQEWKPEGRYHVARASVQANQPDEEALAAARLCHGFAAAENMAAKMAALDGDWRQSEALNKRALEMAPNYWKPLYNLAIISIQDKRYEEAPPLLERARELAPGSAEAHHIVGLTYELLATTTEHSSLYKARAREAFCRARDLGRKEAVARCTE